VYEIQYQIQLCINQLFVTTPITTLDDHVLICKSCEREIKHGKPFDSNLQNHIIENKSNMNFVSMLNNIEECFIASHFAFFTNFAIARIQTIQNTWECCECSNQFESSSKCIHVCAI